MPKRKRSVKALKAEATDIVEKDESEESEVDSEVDSESEEESVEEAAPEGEESEVEESEEFVKLDVNMMSKMANKIKAKMSGNVVAEAAALPERTSIIYLGHIPHGFYEEQMKGFFDQFGKVERLRLSRSKKTGRSRGYAFIEFEDADVAKVVALTMNKYILFDKTLVCHVLAPEQMREKMWNGASFTKPKVFPGRFLNRRKHNGAKTEKQDKARMQRLKASDKKKREKLAALGIDYEFGGYTALLDAKNAPAVIEDVPKKKKSKKSKKTKAIKAVEEPVKEPAQKKRKKEAKTTVKSTKPVVVGAKKSTKPVVAGAKKSTKPVVVGAKKSTKPVKKKKKKKKSKSA